MTDQGASPQGGLPLAAAINALRRTDASSWANKSSYTVNGKSRTLVFKPQPIEVTLEVAVIRRARLMPG